MSLSTNVTDLATRVATEAKSLRTLINGNAANLNALTTTQKGNLVAAINEIAAAVGNASGISDGMTATTTTWSSSKINTELTSRLAALVASAPTALDTLDELAAALGDDPAFATSVTTALGNRVRFDASQTLTAPQQAQARSNIAAASAATLTQLTTDVGSTTANYVTTFEAGLV